MAGKEFSGLDIDATNRTFLLINGFVDEIVISTGLSLVLAVLWLYLAKNKVLVRILGWIRATNRYGDEDVWDYTFNSSLPNVQYVHVRDFDKDITYAGWVEAFSASGELRELLLRDVIIYDRIGRAAAIPLMYLARIRSDIHIEFPARIIDQRDEPEDADG